MPFVCSLRFNGLRSFHFASSTTLTQLHFSVLVHQNFFNREPKFHEDIRFKRKILVSKKLTKKIYLFEVKIVIFK